jgi:hypothetical protein
MTVQAKAVPTAKIKEVGAFGSLLNSVKASASVIEVTALAMNQAAMLGLNKIQQEAMESARDSGWDCNSYKALNQASLSAARAAYK